MQGGQTENHAKLNHLSFGFAFHSVGFGSSLVPSARKSTATPSVVL